MQSLDPVVPGAGRAASHLAAPRQRGGARVPDFVHTHFLPSCLLEGHVLGHAPEL